MNQNEMFTTCACCGSGIKYVVRINGKNYGTTCASHLLGTSILSFKRDGEVDVEATKAAEAKRRLTNAEEVAKFKADTEAGNARWEIITASPVANAMVAHFSRTNNRPSKFVASVLCALLFDYGSISEKQLTAVAKTVGLSVTDADLALTVRFKGDMTWHHSMTTRTGAYVNGVAADPELFDLFNKHNASQHKMFELLGIN
jgi:hypothetical protein